MIRLVPWLSTTATSKNTATCPCLRVLRSTHAKVNVTEEGKGYKGDGKGYGNGENGLAGAERGRERQKERRARAGGAAGAEAKTGEPLVGNVQTYRTAYGWDSDD